MGSILGSAQAKNCLVGISTPWLDHRIPWRSIDELTHYQDSLGAKSDSRGRRREHCQNKWQ
ncbi:hypothetical protein N39L_22240 [Limnospira platensis NIES-39]|jgi:hypothetical protein|uniref:Uncharacterized protein n=1 Tax=Limnospira platensis NIES-46 TaxID=1236695 RepID=A0A5M3T765_LIMPL|nr:hypothetical protein N39L_22240 [Arthrospira platensis NIES-39]GCE95324.1 hypothetical protein NIES46_33870 [Arthrospira platensis NIES-46]